MKFKYYDLLSHLVPGLVIYFVLNHEFKDDIPTITTLPLLAISYMIGYFNNTISSWLEGVYRFILGGNPIDKFIDKNGIWKVNYYNGAKVKDLLKESIGNENPTNKELFHEAMRIANAKDDPRISDFNAAYAFSRAILTNMLLVSAILIYSNYTNIWYYVVSVIILFIALLRNRQRNGYYIREILNVSQIELENRETKD
jgi:hypothetical protein